MQESLGHKECVLPQLSVSSGNRKGLQSRILDLNIFVQWTPPRGYFSDELLPADGVVCFGGE